MHALAELVAVGVLVHACGGVEAGVVAAVAHGVGALGQVGLAVGAGGVAGGRLHVRLAAVVPGVGVVAREVDHVLAQIGALGPSAPDVARVRPHQLRVVPAHFAGRARLRGVGVVLVSA